MRSRVFECWVALVWAPEASGPGKEANTAIPEAVPVFFLGRIFGVSVLADGLGFHSHFQHAVSHKFLVDSLQYSHFHHKNNSAQRSHEEEACSVSIFGTVSSTRTENTCGPKRNQSLQFSTFSQSPHEGQDAKLLNGRDAACCHEPHFTYVSHHFKHRLVFELVFNVQFSLFLSTRISYTIFFTSGWFSLGVSFFLCIVMQGLYIFTLF